MADISSLSVYLYDKKVATLTLLPQTPTVATIAVSCKPSSVALVLSRVQPDWKPNRKPTRSQMPA